MDWCCAGCHVDCGGGMCGMCVLLDYLCMYVHRVSVCMSAFPAFMCCKYACVCACVSMRVQMRATSFTKCDLIYY